MATYAIGDVQGCFDELLALVAKIGFDPARDRLWFVGDLVNRGPRSLDVLRYVRGLGDRAVTVLGNHDLHLLCVHAGFARKRADDTLDAVLAAPDVADLLEWLRTRPLMHVDADAAMVHAGLLPQWSVKRARELAAEVEACLRGAEAGVFLSNLYGGVPRRWSDTHTGWDRLRVIVNAMTRLRFCTVDGEMNLRAKGLEAPRGTLPWFDTRGAHADPLLVCGHWSALGLKLGGRIAVLDTGCVWGGALSALRLDDRHLVQVPCAGYQQPVID